VEIFQGIDVGTVLVQFAVLLFSLSIHEASHAWMADRLGDYTARYLGRVTLNPIAHIDIVGTVLFPLIALFARFPIIGWAKPVPVNPVHLKQPQRDHMLISVAGPGANLLAATVSFSVLSGLMLTSPKSASLIIFLTESWRIPQQQTVLAPILGFLFFCLVINLLLALFNMLPIPPLDGHWILHALLPYNASRVLETIGGYGIFILYGLMFLGLFRYLMMPIYWVLDFLVWL
jgi:Zn-dependent protease